MPDNNDFFNEYREALKAQADKVQSAAEVWQAEESKLFRMQREYGEKYKAKVIRRFLNAWNNSGKFARDDELTNAVFYLAGLELEEGIPTPKIELNFDKLNNTFHLKYYNVRCKRWIELKP
jgi:hypothetical protein